MLFEHREMLEGRSVKDHLGAPPCKQCLEAASVTNVEQDEVWGVQKCSSFERQLQTVQRGLIAVEHDELGRPKTMDLAAELRADRTAGSGDEDSSASEVTSCHGEIGPNLSSTK
jgi:hypothetical protein